MSIHPVLVVSDIHFPIHHERGWAAVKQFAADVKPERVIAAGDIVDLQVLSSFDPDEQCVVDVSREIKMGANELNEISQNSELDVVPGNHEDRWDRAILGKKYLALRGCSGLGLEDQFRAQGLRSDAKWRRETAASPFLPLGKNALIILHGHNQKNSGTSIAVKNAARFAGVSTLVGHHHRAQLHTHTVLGKTHISIANPHLSNHHEYMKTPNWQRGFTFLEFYGHSRLRDCTKFTPHLIIMDENGSFCWNGKVYG